MATIPPGPPPGANPGNWRARLSQWAETQAPRPYFTGQSLESAELRRWFTIIEDACIANHVPRESWSEAGILYILGDLKHVMQERMDAYLQREQNQTFWRWDDFKDDLTRLIAETARVRAEAQAEDPTSPLANFRRDHPFIAASAGVGLFIGGSIVVLPALGVMALNFIGFSASGVVGGSLAATLQSILYGGATSGLFSFFQSVGATAVLPTLGSLFASSAAVGTGAALLTSDSSQPEDEQADGQEQRAHQPGPPQPGPGRY